MRVFFDMDGTLCEFRKSEMSDLYKEGYFYTLKPHMNIVTAAREMAKEREVYILSSVLSDSPYALKEKNDWLDLYLPEIEKRLFPPCGASKLEAVPGGVIETDILIDDYGVNVIPWREVAKTIKVSRDRLDSIKEMSRHEYVISPDSKPEEIVRLIREIGG